MFCLSIMVARCTIRFVPSRMMYVRHQRLTASAARSASSTRSPSRTGLYRDGMPPVAFNSRKIRSASRRLVTMSTASAVSTPVAFVSRTLKWLR